MQDEGTLFRLQLAGRGGGEGTGPHPGLMEQLIQAYVRYLSAERNLSAYTLRNYRSDLSDFARYLETEEHLGPLEVDRQFFRRYLGRLHEAGTATATVSRPVTTIHTLYPYL